MAKTDDFSSYFTVWKLKHFSFTFKADFTLDKALLK